MRLDHWARLYINLTKAEKLLEYEVARLGERYRTQYPFFGIHAVVDFALLDRALIIEVDGNSHNSLEAKIKDQARTIALKRLGWDVVRVRNEAVELNPKLALANALRCPPSTLADLEREYRELLIQLESLVSSGSRPRPRPRPNRSRSAAPQRLPREAKARKPRSAQARVQSESTPPRA